MNPNLSRLPVKASIIICLFCGLGACNTREHFDDRKAPELFAIAADPANPAHPAASGLNPYPTIGAIPPPAGYHRIAAPADSFAAWLRNIPLKKDRTVRLYDGTPKFNQDAQFAVLDISVGHTDLQQCADAVMRLRAEFLYSHKEFKEIEFRTGQGARLNFGEWAAGKRWRETGGHLVAYRASPGSVRQAGPALQAGLCLDRTCFWDYLQVVFAYCGTLSLERQLDPLNPNQGMRIGDVMIHGGSPGHAMLVVDMAADTAGRKIYMLAQGYMPAQDIHVVRNGDGSGLSPWYRIDYDRPVYTPEYTFYPGQLRTWPGPIN